MSNDNDELNQLSKSAKESLKVDPSENEAEGTSTIDSEDLPKKKPKSALDKSFFQKNKKAIGIGAAVFVVLMLFVALFGSRDIQVERPSASEEELNARLESEVARRVAEESAKMAEQRNQVIDRISRNFDCNAPQVFCHTQDTTEPYNTVVASLQNFQFLPDTAYEVYIEVYPLKVDIQGQQRKGSICSPNNIHLFLCQKVVIKNPAQMANQIRELYALLTPSMVYRLQISGRPITASDIDLALIATELDKMNAPAVPEKPVPCIPPDPNKDPVEYNLYETKARTCEDLMKDRLEREAARAKNHAPPSSDAQPAQAPATQTTAPPPQQTATQ